MFKNSVAVEKPGFFGNFVGSIAKLNGKKVPSNLFDTKRKVISHCNRCI